MSNLTIENVYTRHKAKELAKKHFWKLLGMMLIVFLIVYAISFAGIALMNIPVASSIATSVISLDGVENAYVNGNPSDTVNAALSAANASTSINPLFIIIYIVMMIVNALVSGGLSLGLTSAMLDLCRGKEYVTVGRVFSRMGQCPKALGLSLWMGLKTILWALPGYALMGIAMVLILSMSDGASAQANEAVTTLLMLMPVMIMIVIFALVIPAVYRYLLSTYVLADKPDTGVFACVNESKALMKGHKWQAFKLIIPTFLILYVLLVVLVLVFSLLIAALVDISTALTVIVTILFFVAFFGLVMYFAIRMGLAYCIFYLNRQGEGAAEGPDEAAFAE